MSQSAPDSELLSQGIVSIKGMTIRQAMFRLAKVIAIVKPPIRSWNWVAEWLTGHGVVSERGGPIKGSTLKLYWQEVKKAGLADDGLAEKTLATLKESLLTDESIEAVLEKALRAGEDKAGAALREAGLRSVQSRSPVPKAIHEGEAKTTSITPSIDKPRAPAPPPKDSSNPDFEAIRAAIIENMRLPDSTRTAMIRVNGGEMLVPMPAQARVRDGKINSLDELHQAMEKRR